VVHDKLPSAGLGLRHFAVPGSLIDAGCHSPASRARWSRL
jgi:hypothetical protein